jgi:hypothetical protein
MMFFLVISDVHVELILTSETVCLHHQELIQCLTVYIYTCSWLSESVSLSKNGPTVGQLAESGAYAPQPLLPNMESLGHSWDFVLLPMASIGCLIQWIFQTVQVKQHWLWPGLSKWMSESMHCPLVCLLSNKDPKPQEPTICACNKRLHHPSHQSLMVAEDTVSKMENKSILPWLIAQEDFVVVWILLLLDVVCYNRTHMESDRILNHQVLKVLHSTRNTLLL